MLSPLRDLAHELRDEVIHLHGFPLVAGCGCKRSQDNGENRLHFRASGRAFRRYGKHRREPRSRFPREVTERRARYTEGIWFGNYLYIRYPVRCDQLQPADIPQTVRLVVGLVPRRLTIEVHVEVFQRVAEFARPKPYHMTEVLGSVGDSAATVVTAVGLPCPEHLVAPRQDAVGERFHGETPLSKICSGTSMFANAKMVNLSTNIDKLLIFV